VRLINADCLEALKALPDCSIDAVVTDPPYGLNAMKSKDVAECLAAWASGETWEPRGRGFMGKSWDAWVPPPEVWREVHRVLKPGGHALVFAGSRTQDLMSVALRLAGFEVRDTVQWLYGSGFPKSLDVSKAIDKMKGAQGEVLYTDTRFNEPSGIVSIGRERTKVTRVIRAPSSDEAREWEGWETALKPAYEPAILVRKELDGTVANNVLEHGVGGLNIEGCRVPTNGEQIVRTSGRSPRTGASMDANSLNKPMTHTTPEGGRYPSNVILDELASAALTEQAGDVSRFFYTAKASKKEREAGLDATDGRANVHPTVKPIDLMRYLCRLITPPNGTVLDPFMGSGSTGCAAALEGFDFVGIERETEYFEIAQRRIEHWRNEAKNTEPKQGRLL
jgi:DNA modification methylase